MPFKTQRWYSGEARRPRLRFLTLPLCRWRGAMDAVGLAVGMLLVASSPLSAATAPRQQVNYLWSIPSATGSLTGPNDQHLVLQLGGVRDYLTRFTDRPVRQAYVVANTDFVRRFQGYFADANPNAVLTFSQNRIGIPTEIVLQIGQPEWDPQRSTLTFPAVRIPQAEDDLPDTTVHIKPPLFRNPRSFFNATLFIDSGKPKPCGTAADSLATAAVLC
jgi:hypothetical protein